MSTFQKIFDWNTIANNGKPPFNRHLETSMLTEELAELIIAMKDNNKIEQLDAFADIIFVLTGTMQKLGFSPEQLENTMEEVISSNFTKFIKDENGEFKAIKDETGKIQKPETYTKPNIAKFL